MNKNSFVNAVFSNPVRHALCAMLYVLCSLLFTMDAFAAEKLTVKDSTGTTKFSVTDDGTVTAQKFVGPTGPVGGGGGDVDTWTRNLALPVGTWTSYGDIVVDASRNLLWPSILYRNNQYELFYTAYNATTTGYDLYLTTSADGLTNWSASTLIFSNSTRNYSHSVFYNRKTGRYECFYQALNGSVWDVKFIYSTDGRTNWSAPVTAIAGANVGIGVAAMVAGDGLYLVFARTTDNLSLKLWTSKSPSSGFGDRGIVISNAAGTWEDNSVGYPSLYQNNGNIYCFYAAYNTKYQIGPAFQSVSQILGTTAARFIKNVFNPSISESGNAYGASLIQTGSEFRMYYAYVVGSLYRIKLSRIVLGN